MPWDSNVAPCMRYTAQRRECAGFIIISARVKSYKSTKWDDGNAETGEISEAVRNF